jgi:nucleoside-diphosphate-sugar epimerase
MVELDLHAIPIETLSAHLDGCDTVISCLGHTLTPRGIFGSPRDLVEQAVRNVRDAVEARRPAAPIHLILMSSVSVNRPDRADTRRGAGERAFLGGLRLLVPPARDNQRAADALLEVGPSDPHFQWVAVRPDTLIDGDVSEYAVHDELVASLRRPDHTRMANVAHFMCDLTTDEATWRRWRGRMPVVVDTGPAD